jgi:glycosyltransferase involved in cell wall biosynthesis
MNTPKPAITVAIPTLGRDGVLVDTITQVLNQDFDSFEVVIVDQSARHDAKTQRFLEDRSDPRLRYFLVAPPSLPAARNFAIAQARADIVLFLDDDVILEPGFIRYHYEAFQQDAKIVAVGGRVINKTNTQELTKEPLLFDHLARGRNTFNCDVSQYSESFPGGNMSIKKTAIQKIGGFDTRYLGSAEREESDTAHRLLRAGGKIYFEARASILHLAAPVGGSRIFVPYFDSLRFYQNDLLFTLKVVRPWDLPLSLAMHYRDAIHGQTPGATLRRTKLFARGLSSALARRWQPRQTVAKPVTPSYSIAIDARPLAGPHNGYTTYLTSIIEPLLEAGWQITLLSNRPLDDAHSYAKRCHVEVFGPRGGFRWEQTALPAYLREHRFDLYFAGANRGVPRRSANTRTILGLLDVIPFKFARYYLLKPPFHFARHELFAQASSIYRADALVTISEHSARDIRRFTGRRATPLLINLPGIGTLPHEKPLKQFVYVGGVDPRKRIGSLIRAFTKVSRNHPDYQLVLIGRGYEVFNGLIQELGIGERVVLTGFLSDADKIKTLQQSRALVYPSLYEGYGLAIAEGLQVGVPVIAGRGGSQAEIGGEAVRYIDPDDPDDIAKAMTELTDETVAKRWREAGRKQLARLTDSAVAASITNYFANQAEIARKDSA